MNFKTFDEFWSFFVNQHSKPLTRRWHFAGTLMGFIFLVYSILFKWWFVFFVPIVAYGCAWYSHFCVERNVPVSFGHHPFWSFMCDIKMFSLMLTGKMDKEIKRLGKRPVLQVIPELMDLEEVVSVSVRILIDNDSMAMGSVE